MARPTNRREFANYCLRKLGAPVTEVNVDLQQVEDRIDDALDKYFEYHFDGVEEKYLAVAIQDSDVANGYIEFEDDIFSVVKVVPFTNTSSIGSANLFTAQYQFFLNDFYGTPGSPLGGLQYLDQMKSYLNTLELTLNPVHSFNFNRKTNRVYFNQSLSSIKEEVPYLLFKVYKRIDVNTFPEVWDDNFLKEYATALIKKQWGSNIKKFGSLNLPGGITLNGDAIYSEAETEIEKLETKLINDLQGPYTFFLG